MDELKIAAPAQFILRNSRGKHDFIMTMLVWVILAFLLTLIFWMALNFIGFKIIANNANAQPIADFLKTFNDNARLIVLGICSSIFSLAGAYFLRRANAEKVDALKLKTSLDNEQLTINTLMEKSNFGRSIDTSISRLPQVSDQELVNAIPASTILNPEQSKRNHPAFDDEEEDI